MAEDIISNLPDFVLCHVLSFVPTKQAIATSLLSKRWRYLWRSVTTLDFCNSIESGQKAHFRFNQFVYSVLLSRDADHPIKSFRLQFQSDYHDCGYLGFANVVKWVNFVVQRRVEYLHLELFPDSWAKLPISILTCRTLVFLKLRSLSVEGFSSAVLPSLKTLHFEYIVFSEVRNFMLLLGACPNLVDLHVIGVTVAFESVERSEWKNFSLSKLIRAEIVDSYFDFPMKPLQNVESLRIEIAKVYVSNDAIPTFQNLTHLDLIDLDFKWNLLAELLKHCPKLQRLDLDQSDTDEVHWTGEEGDHIWVDPEFVPQCLSLHLRTCNLFNFLGLQGELLLASYILKNARVLQTMVIWNEGLTNIKRLLSSCPRASATCKLTVYDDRPFSVSLKSGCYQLVRFAGFKRRSQYYRRLRACGHGGRHIKLPVVSLFRTLGMCLADEAAVLLFHSLLQGNSALLEDVLVWTDMDTFFMLILEAVYNAAKEQKKPCVVVFVGVNGVGKSTDLAKVA